MESEEFLKKIIQMGSMGYGVDKIINILDIEEKDKENFAKQFYDKSSLIYKSYKKGVDKADFLVDSKLFDLAKNGDLKAIEMFTEKKKINLWDNKRSGNN